MSTRNEGGLSGDLVLALTKALLVTPEHLSVPHARLAVASADDGVLDVAYRTWDTPVGTPLLVVPAEVEENCHRVIRADGSLGGDLDGLDAERTAIALEAAV